MNNVTWVYPLALLFDLVVGDPRSNLHPVALIGRMIAWFERRLLVMDDPVVWKRIKGALLVLLVLAITYGTAFEALSLARQSLPPVAQ